MLILKFYYSLQYNKKLKIQTFRVKQQSEA